MCWPECTEPGRECHRAAGASADRGRHEGAFAPQRRAIEWRQFVGDARVGQRIQKGLQLQIVGDLDVTVDRVDERIAVVGEVAAARVEVDDFAEALQQTVVEVAAAQGHVAQARHPELAAIGDGPGDNSAPHVFDRRAHTNIAEVVEHRPDRE